MLPHWRRRRGLRRGGGAYHSRSKVPAALAAPKAGSRASSGRATQGASSLRAPGRGYPGTASDGPTNFTAVDCVGAVELRGGLDDDEELRYLVAEDDL